MYIWQGALFSYSDAEGASGGLSMMWNPNRIIGSEIFQCQNSVGVEFSHLDDS